MAISSCSKYYILLCTHVHTLTAATKKKQQHRVKMAPRSRGQAGGGHMRSWVFCVGLFVPPRHVKEVVRARSSPAHPALPCPVLSVCLSAGSPSWFLVASVRLRTWLGGEGGRPQIYLSIIRPPCLACPGCDATYCIVWARLCVSVDRIHIPGSRPMYVHTHTFND